MRTGVIALLVISVVCLFSTKTTFGGQEIFLDETVTKAIIESNIVQTKLALENNSSSFAAEIKLEILNVRDEILAQRFTQNEIKAGKQILNVPLKIESSMIDIDSMLWYRLRYRVAAKENPNLQTSGIISFSRLLPGIFQLQAFAGSGILENKIYRVRVLAVNPFTQEPAENVEIVGEIQIEDGEKQIKTRAKTDANGTALLEFDMPNFLTEDDLEIKISGKKDGVMRNIKDNLSNFALKMVNLQTDKTIYQPEQTLNLRLYQTDFSLLPVKNSKLTVEVMSDDDDEELVFTQKVTTSKFGIAATNWKIPASAKLGNYQILVKDAENNEINQTGIKITRYDLPNFYIYAKPVRAFYLPSQNSAKVEIQADYLFGKTLEKGKVRIVSTPKSYGENYKIPEIEGELDETGKFTAEIDISKAHKNFDADGREKFEDLNFTAYVTDSTTGRTEQKRFDVRLTQEAIHVYLIGDTYDQSGRLPLNFYLSTFYADGRPAVCDVEIFELIEREEKDSPDEIGKLLSKVQTNSYGAARLNLPVSSETDEINIKIIAKDKKGETGMLEENISFNDEPAVRIATDKIAYRRSEPIKVSINSSEQSETVFVDVVRKHQLIYTQRIRLENGRGELTIPYREDFENNLTVAAYIENKKDDEIELDTKGIIYPTPDYLAIKADTKKSVFRPGEEATVNFTSLLGGKTGTETALGVLVLDKAIEQRAGSLSELGSENSFLNRTFISPLSDFFGDEKVFGNVSVNNIKNLDLSKPVKPDLQLVLEIALRNGGYKPSLMENESLEYKLKNLYLPRLQEQLNSLRLVIEKSYSEKSLYPKDEKSFRQILLANNINFANLKDPWGNSFRTEFRIKKDRRILEIWTNGADEISHTFDDIKILDEGWKYFSETGNIIDKALLDYTTRTDGFITDYKTLREEVLKQNLNLDKLRDAWGNPYKFEFSVDRVNYVLTIKSLGEDGKAENANGKSDDFRVWKNEADYFIVTKAKLKKGFNDHIEKNKTFPETEAEMRNILEKIGFDLDKLKDIFGHSFYIQKRENRIPLNVYIVEGETSKKVRQKVLNFAVRSKGKDGIEANYDDFELINFSGVMSEEVITDEDNSDDFFMNAIRIIRQKTVTTPNGAVGGTVFDPTGAVIPGATAEVFNTSRTFSRAVTSNDEGKFLLDNLPPDVYSLKVFASGFESTVISNLKVEASILIEVGVSLNVGGVTATVDVSSNAVEIMNTTDSAISNTITKSDSRTPKRQPVFTPRVRNYFAENLFWSPELITDKNGKAEIKFKMADSLTTWKLYAVGTDENGKIGVVEKELQTFKPFFAELDPPKILTEGDEISLPVPVRNYTEKPQNVSVKMSENVWSKMLNGSTREIKVDADSTQNAVFDFRAVSPIENGTQKVTAIAKEENDAIEKTVKVKPNGKEIVETQAKLFQNETSFEVNFPVNAFSKTQKAELKIYPNMLSHVAESIEGLLKRPYGCGEQTTSSTYPNLMILKVEKELGKPIDANLKKTASEYLQEGYRRLLNYQTDSGFGYWNGNNSDIALTAYVLRFLNNAEGFIEVDEKVIEKAEDWLLKQQKPDGSWTTSRGNTDISTAYVARSLSLTGGNKDSLQKALAYLKGRFAENKIDDSFVLANLALTAIETGDLETANAVTAKLAENENAIWTTKTTPFHGWGKSAEIETTALVLQALLKTKNKNEPLIFKGLSFILQNKDKYGVWYSTQTTVNVLDNLILFQEMQQIFKQNSPVKVEIFINGVKIKEIEVSKKELNNPFLLDVSEFLKQENKIQIKGFDSLAMSQIVSTYYVKWNQAKEDSGYFDLQVIYDKNIAKIGEEIICNVGINRKQNRWGMVLAEIGIPPGADVDPLSLERSVKENTISRYDILPDKIIVYMWLGADKKDFKFTFKPRFGINAQTSPSLVYDYYNAEAKAMIAPTRFEVRSDSK